MSDASAGASFCRGVAADVPVTEASSGEEATHEMHVTVEDEIELEGRRAHDDPRRTRDEATWQETEPSMRRCHDRGGLSALGAGLR